VARGEARARLEPTRLRGDYERLRDDALAGGAMGWRWGRSLIARAGVAGWIRTWSEHAAATEEAIVKSPATPYPSGMPTLERFGPAGSASGTGTAASAPRDREAIVALLALMLRGLLSGVPGAGANA
jgi:hypothetical protein